MALDLELLDVPPGTVLIGSTDQQVEEAESFWRTRLLDQKFRKVFQSWLEKEVPAHIVSLPGYRMMKYPVTEALYYQFLVDKHPSSAEPITSMRHSALPIADLQRDSIRDFIDWASGKVGVPLRLPTEYEWERAARAGTQNEYPYGPCFDSSKANTVESGVHERTPVDRYSKHRNAFGFVDMAGNVEELTSSLYAPYPSGTEVRDHLYTIHSGRYPILRGGSWALGGDLSRCARRHGPGPENVLAYKNIGFRLVALG